MTDDFHAIESTKIPRPVVFRLPVLTGCAA
jgi:hypothetical protein